MVKVAVAVDISEQYKAAHAESSLHKETLLKSRWVGCFYCEKIYRPNEVIKWVDDGKTAICPFCGIDSVIPATPERFDSDFFEQMEKIYFHV
jgi:hypothetical protein